MKYIFLLLIRLYQKTLSYDHGLLGKIFPNVRFCRHTPTCSEYGYQAIDKYGVIKGGWMAFQRVLRCNPSTPMGAYDPVR